MTGGAFMFCTRPAYETAGGFDERLFGAEDAAFAWAIKRHGPFVVLWRRVATSGRRTHGMSGFHMISALFRMAFFPNLLRRRESVEKVWYESQRVETANVARSWAMRFSNALMLIIMIALITQPLWMFVPWSLTPWDTWPGKIRYGIAILSCHIGLVLLPCAYFLARIWVGQTRWVERIKIALLIALCLWFGLSGAREVFYFWRWICVLVLEHLSGQ